MALTPAQLLLLKADILANVATIPAGQPWTNGFAGVAVNAVPNSGDGNATVAGWYSQKAIPDWIVWRDVPMEDILNLITFANMTPLDAVPTTPDLTVQVWIARSLACQGKQFNLQNLTIGRTTAPMEAANYRAALQDALTGLPAGAAGAIIAANWAGVRDAAKFTALRVEKVLSTGTGSTASPADLGYEGTVTADQIEAARSAA